MHNLRTLLCILILITIPNTLFAQVKPAGVFGDHMVLQQGRTVPIWGKSAANETITVIFNGQKVSTKAGADGKWKLNLSSMNVGGPYKMVIKGTADTVTYEDIYIGEVWLCSGQSNMEMTVTEKGGYYWCGVNNQEQEEAAANYPMIRVFNAPSLITDETQTDLEAKWEICSPKTVGHFCATAYFFARELQKSIDIPIGLVTTAYGASTAEAWTSREALEAKPELKFLLDNYAEKCADYDSGSAIKEYEAKLEEWKAASEKAKAAGEKEPKKPGKPRNPHTDQHNPSLLYNGMVAPLVPYAIRGAIWYQGESNAGTADIYDVIMETLIECWRDEWGQGDFPFYFVQLANFRYKSNEPCKGGGTTEVRDSQLKNLSIPNTGMAVSVDIGNAKNIHPKNKQEVGRRLSLLAENRVYDKTVTDSGPIFDHIIIDGNKIQVFFKDYSIGKGLIFKTTKLQGFAVAGKDHKFVWADAEINGDTIVVSSPEVISPIAVRYGWNDNPYTSLYNKDGLPASPFRSDDF